MPQRISWAIGLTLAGLYAGGALADDEGCRQAVQEQEAVRAIALRDAEGYAACLSRSGMEDSCTTEFGRLAAAHSDLGTVAWRRLRECS